MRVLIFFKYVIDGYKLQLVTVDMFILEGLEGLPQKQGKEDALSLNEIIGPIRL